LIFIGRLSNPHNGKKDWKSEFFLLYLFVLHLIEEQNTCTKKNEITIFTAVVCQQRGTFCRKSDTTGIRLFKPKQQ